MGREVMQRGDSTSASAGAAEAIGLARDDLGSQRAVPRAAETAPDLARLERIARTVRRDIVNMTAEAGSGHPGGSLSSVEILVALYFSIMRTDSNDPRWPDRDRFVLSKGHACPVLYSALARRGFFPVEELSTFRKIDSRLQGHAHVKTPGVEMSAGSLGQGLSFALGTALAARLDGRPYRSYALLGDGECEEGQVWEAAMAASFYGVDNLTAIVDRNGIQNDRFTSQVAALEPLADKWRAFGWHVLEADGHDLAEVLGRLRDASAHEGEPTVIIAHTVKGKGVSFMENNPDFHGKVPNPEQLAQALSELAD
jgi:transketolase